MNTDATINSTSMQKLRESVELEADKLTTKIIQKVQQNYTKHGREVSLQGFYSERSAAQAIRLENKEKCLTSHVKNF